MKKKFFILLLLALSAVFSGSKLSAQTIIDVGGFDTSEDMFEGSVFEKAPINYMYKYSCTQQIYTADELAAMEGMKIVSIKFRCWPDDYDAHSYTNDLRIYLKEVDYSEYVKQGDKYVWERVEEGDLVYTGAQEIDFQTATYNGEDIEMEFVLDKPFAFWGGHLMVMVVQQAPECLESTYTDFYCYPGNVLGKPYTTLYACDDSSTLDTPYPTGTESALKQRAVVKFACVENDDPHPVEDFPFPLFLGLKDEYDAGDDTVPLKLKGKDREILTVFTVNGTRTEEFNPLVGGTYKIEASSEDGNHRITKYVKVK